MTLFLHHMAACSAKLELVYFVLAYPHSNHELYDSLAAFSEQWQHYSLTDYYAYLGRRHHLWRRFKSDLLGSYAPVAHLESRRIFCRRNGCLNGNLTRIHSKRHGSGDTGAD